ncbi:MAG: hypothetical protein HOP08_08850 [Cyclobacteriaceae bacterium]|nr:hypothetical protein [Cyclobacteriaceae bacterium]
MWKFIIILVLLIYVLNKVSSLIFKVAGPKQTPPNFRKPPEGTINMNSAPPQPKKKGGLKGGEYVDYEEVK